MPDHQLLINFASEEDWLLGSKYAVPQVQLHFGKGMDKLDKSYAHLSVMMKTEKAETLVTS